MFPFHFANCVGNRFSGLISESVERVDMGNALKRDLRFAHELVSSLFDGYDQRDGTAVRKFLSFANNVVLDLIE